MEASPERPVFDVSLVVPVYQGERTLALLAGEVAPLVAVQETAQGHAFRVVELDLGA